MQQNDLIFSTSEGRFKYRVGAIIIKDNKLLMVKNDQTPYYYALGGKVKYWETSEEAVVREVFEETGCMLEIDRLAFIEEKMFTKEVTNEHFHQIGFFYLMKLNEQTEFKRESLTELGVEEHLHWLPIEELDDIHLHPKFYKQYIKDLPQHIIHIIKK